MQVFEITEKEMRERFRTERQCVRYLMHLKYPEGMHCRKCGSKKVKWYESRWVYHCSLCGYQESAKAHTLFHDSHVCLRDWFWSIYYFSSSKGGISALELQRRLGFGSYKTAWLLLNKLRRAMQKRDQNYTLQGLIELDGAHFGKRKHKNQGVFFIAVESFDTHAGFAKVSLQEGGTRQNAEKLVEKDIRPGSWVNTDGGRPFRKIDALPIEHDYQHSDDQGHHEQWSPWIHTVISNIKAMLIGTYHGVRRKHLPLYLSEYLYRFNRRAWPQQSFNRLLIAAIAAPPNYTLEIRG